MNFSQTTQYVIKTLSISTKSGVIDITGIFEELSIVDSVFSPCMSGHVVIKDANNLNSKFQFDGSEFLLVEISKQDLDLTIKKVFRIYKQTDRRAVNPNTEAYVLHFVSEEYLLSIQQKVSRRYDATYSGAVARIMADFLHVNSLGVFDETVGIKNIVVPSLSPIDAINWMAKKSVGKDRVPGFLFYENIDGYNFANITTLLSSEPVTELNMNVKNLSLDNSDLGELVGIRHFEVMEQYDLLHSIKNGVHAGKYIGIDSTTSTLVERPFSFNDLYASHKPMNDSPGIPVIDNKLGSSFEQYNSYVVVGMSDVAKRSSEYFKSSSPDEITKADDMEMYVLQRPRIMSSIMKQRIKLVIPGNFGLSSGYTFKLKVPKYGIKSEEEDVKDDTLYGNYLIVGTRHLITYEKHETIMEAVKESNYSDTKNVIYRSGTQG